MPTGVESFVHPDQVGPMYPFVGVEWLFFIVAVALWVLWHWWQIGFENQQYDEASRLYKEGDLDAALRAGGSELEAKTKQVREAMHRAD